jgi:hypothetical protein
MSRLPKVELLWWRGCPSTERALGQLRQVMEETGLDPDQIEVREVETEAQAREEDFVGSPTIVIDGSQMQPPGDDPRGLTCRVYRMRDGRYSPTPDLADVRDAILRAMGERT